MMILARLLYTVAALLGVVFLGGADTSTKRIKPAADHLFFRCKLLINPANANNISDAVIETGGGKILRVGEASGFTPPADAKVIDFRDHYVIPGLVDTHGHLYARPHLKTRRWEKTDARLPIFYLGAGVTTIGDPGS